MIRNRLAELLAERKLKVSRVANDLPNLSRNTITSVAKNSTKMIQIETVNSLCQYLDVSPNDFFEYIPFDVKLNTIFDDNLLSITDNVYFDVICLKNLSFLTYLNKISSNININSQTFDLSISPVNKYVFIPIDTGDNGNPFNQREFKNKNIFDIEFNILLGHYEDEDTYKEQIEQFKKLWFNDLSAGFRSNIEYEIKTQIINMLQEKIKKDSSEDINFLKVNFSFSFNFDNAYNFKLKNNEQMVKDDFNDMPFDLPF